VHPCAKEDLTDPGLHLEEYRKKYKSSDYSLLLQHSLNCTWISLFSFGAHSAREALTNRRESSRKTLTWLGYWNKVQREGEGVWHTHAVEGNIKVGQAVFVGM